MIISAARILNIPCGIVINRFDLGDDKVNDYANSSIRLLIC
jgi:MinD superfamily P-loop ATPase